MQSAGGARAKEVRRVDTTREWTEWKEDVRRECTREEKVLEKRAPQREKRREEEEEDDEGVALAAERVSWVSATPEVPPPPPPSPAEAKVPCVTTRTSTMPAKASSQVQTPLPSNSFMHSTPSVLS
mmetsp:Transcript_3316/g.7469  ORF Transcript_3316/g.7469 Transcript_3316/m.7469 type:complete len:126 (-) Transcript_3316:978-1355(-)